MSADVRVEVSMSPELLERVHAFRAQMERTGREIDQDYAVSLSDAICVLVARRLDERERTLTGTVRERSARDRTRSGRGTARAGGLPERAV